MVLGIVPDDPVREAFSTAYTRYTIPIPSNAITATLKFWWQRHTEETTQGRIATTRGPRTADLSLRSLLYDQDLQEALLLGSDYYSVLEVLERTRTDDCCWVESVHDLTQYRGQSVVLYFNAYNNASDGRTWMYVDDVSLEICIDPS